MTYTLQEAAHSLILQPQARCLVGLYGSNDQANYDAEGRHASSSSSNDYIEKAKFLIGCQSVRPNGSQVHLVTLEDHDLSRPATLTNRAFTHAEGEVVDLTALAAAPHLFVSVYSSLTKRMTECLTGARVWRLPYTTPLELEDEALDFADLPPTQVELEELEYVSTLPLDNYSLIKKIAAHPSETCGDLACILGPPFPTSGSADSRGISHGSSFLGILRAPTGNLGNGDYALESTMQLSIPMQNNYLKLTDDAFASETVVAASDHSPGGGVNLSSPVNAIRWSPHRKACTIAVACDSGVLGIDLRCMQPCFWLEDIHWPCVRDLDFNPNRDHLLATSGDDGCVKLWDLRQNSSCTATRKGTLGATKRMAAATPLATREPFSFRNVGSGISKGHQPLITLSSHSHWVWSVRYHPTRDQLLVSAGSDSAVCLYGLPSFSSDAKELPPASATSLRKPSADSLTHSGSEVDDLERLSFSGSQDSSNKLALGMRDGLLAKLDTHEESVYAVDWSPIDAWVFASVNYDGTVSVNRVPDPIKLDILLHNEAEDDDANEEESEE